MVERIDGNKGPGPLASIKRGGKSDAGKAGAAKGADFASTLQAADKTAGAAARPRVEKPEVGGVMFSPVMAPDAMSAAEVKDAERMARIATLKQQVADGNYQPDLKKVAASLLHYLVRSKAWGDTMATAVAAQLTRLHQIILEERACARALDMEGLSRLTVLKSQLLAGLPAVAELDESTRQLAQAIRRENRRNAYLLWSGLSWVRETMGFFNQQTSPSSYGRQGQTARAGGGGRLLNGKV